MPTTYADRLIDDGRLETATGPGERDSHNAAGNLRSLVVELGGSSVAPQSLIDGVEAPGLNRKQQEAAISVSGRYRTVNFGELGIDAQLRRGSTADPPGGGVPPGSRNGSWNGSVTLTSRELPLGDGWLATTALGATTGPAIDLVRRQPRFSLPAMPILGAAATFDGYRRMPSGQAGGNPAPRVSINIAAGEPGLLGGLRLADYTGLSGRLISAGAQLEISPRWAAGLQVIDVSRTRDPFAAIAGSEPGSGSPAGVSARGAVAALAYTGGDLRLQANAILTSRRDTGGGPWASSSGGAARGAWIDAAYRSGRTAHSGGLYWFEPGLAWGASALIGNVCGAYYRLSTSSQRWRWTLNLDAVRSIEGSGSSGLIANGDVQRRLDFRTTAGINGTVRTAKGQTTVQLLGYLDRATVLGTFRADVGWSREPGASLLRAGFNQTWSLPTRLPAGSRLSTQVFYEQQRTADDPACQTGCRLRRKTGSFGAAISAGLLPASGFSLDATLAYQSRTSSQAARVYGPVDPFAAVSSAPSAQQGRALTATIAANLRLSPRWSLSASYTDSRSDLYSGYGLAGRFAYASDLASARLAQTRRSSFRLRAGYLTLRYALSAGRPADTIGRREYPAGGAGAVEGRIYLDGNGNGRREPSEPGATGIVVILDGAQAVRTDPSGFYRFEGVADGPHRITLNADALPLPWTFENADDRFGGAPFAASIDVGIRATTTLDIPASRRH